MSVLIFIKDNVKATLSELAEKFTEEEDAGDIDMSNVECMYVEGDDIIDAINYVTDEQEDI